MTGGLFWFKIPGIMWGMESMLLKNKASLKAWCGLAVLGALFAIMLASTLTLAPRNACAGAPPVQPCDPLYMDAMEKRAWLAAQRESAMNQNIIVKPDSVLEYTCFDQFLGMLAQRYTNGYLFSEVACCGVTPDFDILNLLLQQGVWNAVVPYLSVNFEHTFRGGNSGQD